MRIKFWTLFVLTFFVKFGLGQVYQSMPQYGYGPVKRMDIDSTLTIPTVCGVPTLKSNIVRKSAIAFDTCNNRFYFYNSKTLIWDTIKGGSGGGGSTDTTSLSNRINLKLNISDTGSMLNPYLRKIDTTNKWVNSVTKLNDSTIRVIKGATTTDITLTPAATVTSATRLITTVYNKSGATITKGSVVYIDGAHSSVLPSIALAKANNEGTSAYTYGLVETDITNNSSGIVIQSGSITNLNLPTSSYTDGQTLYLSPTVAGGYTTTKPSAPNHYVAIGTVTRAHPTLGTIQIAIRNGFQLDEMSDVSIPLVPSDSVLLQFSRVDSLWHDVSPTTAIGSRYIKPSDTASMLTNYAKTSLVNTKLNATDTASLSNRINTKLDATSYEWIWTTGMQALGSTIKGVNLGTPVFYSQGAAAFLTSGAVRFVPYYLPQSQTITGVKFYQANTANYTGNNYNGVGLYSYSGGTLTLVASSTNSASFWINTINTWVTKPFSSTYSASPGIYYIGMMYSFSSQTTAPQTIGGSTVNNAFATFDLTNSAKIAGLSATGQTVLPSTILMSNINSTTNVPLIYLY